MTAQNRGYAHGRRYMVTVGGRIRAAQGLVASAMFSLGLVVGCGTNIDALAFQAAGAAGRTAADLLFTDLLNAFADTLERASQVAADAPDDGNNGGDGNGDGNGGDDDPPMGGVVDGASIFMSNGCATCHCDDGTGNCLLNAPSIVGTSLDVLDNVLRGDAIHPTAKLDVTDEDLAALQEYLARL